MSPSHFLSLPLLPLSHSTTQPSHVSDITSQGSLPNELDYCQSSSLCYTSKSTNQAQNETKSYCMTESQVSFFQSHKSCLLGPLSSFEYLVQEAFKAYNDQEDSAKSDLTVQRRLSSAL